MTDRRDESRWKIERSFNISHALTVLALAVGLLMVYVKNETRVSALELAITYQRAISTDNKADTVARISQVSAKVDKVSDKLDEMSKFLYTKQR